MKKVLLTLLACLPVIFVNAQNCTADPAFQDSTGVFPLPYDPDVSPDGGIRECAVIGEEYNFTLTVGVGDSITVFGQRLALDAITIENVTGLPVGVNVIYEPANAIFPAGSIGCAKLTGIPTNDNDPGLYDLTISAIVSFENPLFPDFPVTFPDTSAASLAPGEYVIQVLADAGDDCMPVSTRNVLAEKVSLQANPNPSAGPLNIEINADIFGDFNMHVVDLLGQSVHREKVRINQGFNNFPFDGTHLANGLYFLVLENELGRVAQKITIQH
ncbi:MAG: T9SS type A sorting domain-containing protein [Bacteroidota bacterium]